MTFWLVVIWIFASLIEGVSDGFYYHHWNTSASPTKIDLHPLFTLRRAVVGLCLTYIYCMYAGISLIELLDISIAFDVFLFGISLMLIFSWFHNGMYLTTRNYFDKNLYPHKWTDDSTTSIAKGEFPFVLRSFFAFAGVLILCIK